MLCHQWLEREMRQLGGKYSCEMPNEPSALEEACRWTGALGSEVKTSSDELVAILASSQQLDCFFFFSFFLLIDTHKEINTDWRADLCLLEAFGLAVGKPEIELTTFVKWPVNSISLLFSSRIRQPAECSWPTFLEDENCTDVSTALKNIYYKLQFLGEDFRSLKRESFDNSCVCVSQYLTPSRATS